MAASRPTVSVVIPVYRSEEILPKLHVRLVAALDAMGDPWEIVFVDDGSPDSSWSVLERLAENPGTVAIQLMKNGGQQRAVLAGIASSQGDVIVTMDDDLQQRPEEIHLLVDELRRTGNDVVIGRYADKKHGAVRGFGTRLVATLAHNTIGVPEGLALTSFRAISRRAADALSTLRPYNPVVGYMLAAVTDRMSNIDVSHDERASGTSSYSLLSLVRYFRAMVMDYSDLPLRLVGMVGLGASAVSALLGLFYLLAWSTGRIGAPGFLTPVLLILFLSGLILASIGIIGAYLVRILRSATRSDMWVIRDRRQAD